ncbi:unnamed protein product [Fraxinus pennsylvanica]|uniref:Uncharacterized protein n=1 Tax=Fraxinus pennsylvanica TaxID=56036 RepID=A0AAD1YXH5_9LAMI|nr:unnamed protein product [Fraxinus pennsylvanica]
MFRFLFVIVKKCPMKQNGITDLNTGDELLRINPADLENEFVEVENECSKDAVPNEDFYIPVVEPENGTLRGGSDILEPDRSSGDASEDLKRKGADSFDAPYSNKSRKFFQDDQQSSPGDSSQHQHKREKMDGSVLRPRRPSIKRKRSKRYSVYCWTG